MTAASPKFAIYETLTGGLDTPIDLATTGKANWPTTIKIENRNGASEIAVSLDWGQQMPSGGWVTQGNPNPTLTQCPQNGWWLVPAAMAERIIPVPAYEDGVVEDLKVHLYATSAVTVGVYAE